MIITKEVHVRIMNKQQFEHFNKLGYNVKYKESITIPIKHLSNGSTIKIQVKCDICGTEKMLSYQKYNKNISKYNIYTCNENCARIKNKKTCLEKYGDKNYNNVEKMIETSIKNGYVFTNEQKEENYQKILKIGYKKCIKCGEIKDLSRFSKSKRRKDGFVNVCKDCVNKRRNKKYMINKNNKSYMDKIKKRKRKYFENNKEKVNKQQREYYHNKFKHTNKHQFVWRQILSTTLRRMNKQKENKTIELLGYSAIDLKKHIENLFLPEMSWENYGTEWHIDHIKPVSSFDEDTPVSIVCALDNLQPLWATTREIDGIIYEGNLNKGKKYE